MNKKFTFVVKKKIIETVGFIGRHEYCFGSDLLGPYFTNIYVYSKKQKIAKYFFVDMRKCNLY